MIDDPIIGTEPLGTPWVGFDPFLFCMHHVDYYPPGNEHLGPAASLEGRNLGEDFEAKDGWRMYHGRVVPGFSRHPHCGFETVTVMRRGFTDHADCLGGAARFGAGDVQWMTTGRGIAHAETFPLLDRNNPNPLELFQIWLNLPGKDKRAEPHVTMLWNESIPKVGFHDERGRAAEVTVIAGQIGRTRAPAPPPRSWAADPLNDVAIWTVKLAPDARWTLPAASIGSNRLLYFFRGASLLAGERTISADTLLRLRPDREVTLQNASVESELLLLQGKPIDEPIAQTGRYGPFVLNTPGEIEQAAIEYEKTGFGGWPWPSDGPVLPAAAGRHARHFDGRVEVPASQ